MNVQGRGHDLVRPYVMTGGRTRPQRRDLRVETILQTAPGVAIDALPSEQVAMLRACVEPRSVAEVSSTLGLVIGVVTVIAGDLIAAGHLEVHHTDPVEIELDVLTRMIERVKAI
jgi:hypothetical protein